MLTNPTAYTSPSLGKQRWKIHHQFQHNGQTVRLRKDGFLSAAEAVAWLEKNHAGIIHGFMEPPAQGTRPGRKRKVVEGQERATVAQVWEMVKEDIASGMRAGTFRQRIGHMKNHVLPAIGKIPFVDLDAKSIHKMYQGKTPGIQNAITDSVRSLIKSSEKMGLPFPTLSKRIWQRTTNRKRTDYLTTENINQIKDIVDPAVYPHIIFLIYSGLRFGEYRGLRWADVDLKKRTISITKQRTHYGEEAKTKTGKNRIVPLHAEAINALKMIAAQQNADWVTHGYVVGKSPGLVYSLVTKETKKIAEAFDMPSFVPHCYRHTCASLLIQAGETAEKVAFILGDTPKMINDVYAHLTYESVRSSLETLPSLTA